MLELNEPYSDVSYRIFLARSARGDTPTTATFFNALSGYKVLDIYNKERFTIVFKRYEKITTRNLGLDASTTQAGTGRNSGIYYSSTGAAANNFLTTATKIEKIWIPGQMISKNRVIQYESNGSVQKFYVYE